MWCACICACVRKRKKGGGDTKKDERRKRKIVRTEQVLFPILVHVSSQDTGFHTKWHKANSANFVFLQHHKKHFVKLSTGTAESRSKWSFNMLLLNWGSKSKFPGIIKSPDLLNLALCPETLGINSAVPTGPSGYPTLCSPPPSLLCFSRNNSDKHGGIWPKAKIWVNETSNVSLFHCIKLWEENVYVRMYTQTR